MNALRKNRAYFEVLQKAKAPLRKAIIKHADKQLINCFRLTCYNILRGNIKLKPKDHAKLRKYRRKLHEVYKAKPEVARKQLQSGGFLASIIAAIASGIGGLISALT